MAKRPTFCASTGSMLQELRNRSMSQSEEPYRPRRRGPSSSLDLLAAGVALVDPVPDLDLVLTELPAELDKLTVAVRRKVDQALERSLQLDAHSVQSRHSFQQLELGAADRVARLLVTIAMIVARAVALRIVLGDAGLVLELGHKGREVGDLLHDAADARKLQVCFLHCVRAQSLHGSTI